METGRAMTWARAPGRPSPRSRADSLALGSRQGRFQSPARPTCPMPASRGGSAHTATVGTAIHNAGAAVIAKLAELATNDQRSPLFRRRQMPGVDRARRPPVPPATTTAAAKTSATSSRARRNWPRSTPTATARWTRPLSRTTRCMRMARVFAEVKVDPDLGQIRVSRMVGAFAAGRIVNPRMVKSQYLGGMIWGVSFALHERAIVDHRSGPHHERQSRRVSCAC